MRNGDGRVCGAFKKLSPVPVEIFGPLLADGIRQRRNRVVRQILDLPMVYFLYRAIGVSDRHRRNIAGAPFLDL